MIWRAGIGLAVLAVLVVAAPTVAASTPRQQPSQGAVTTLADCTARTGRLAMVFLIDESASLRDTDPSDRRVEAVKAALTSLAQLADRTAATALPISVDVSLLGFGVASTNVVPWTNLNGSRLPDLLAASDQFATRNSEIDTDYAAALIGARDDIAQQPNTGACTGILWFTDGHYDIESRATGEVKPYAPDIALNGPDDAAALLQAGKQVLCDPGGVVDGLRAGGTQIFAVALSSDVSPIAPEDQDFLESVAEGAAGSARCGAALPSGAPPPGAYLGTEDVTELTAGFFKVIGDLSGGTPLPDVNQQSTATFAVDPGVRSLSLLALTPSADVQIELRSPESATGVAIASGQNQGQSSLGGATVRWTRVDPEAVLIDVTLPSDSGAWNGTWSLGFGSAAGSARFYVFADLEPVLEAVQFRAGEANSIAVTLQHRDGSPADPSLYKSVEVAAEIVNPTTNDREQVALSPPDASGRRTGSWSAPGKDFPAAVNVAVTVRATTASGLALNAITRTTTADVLPPSAYPALQPTQLQFSAVTGVKAQEAVVTVKGGDTSGGCVWLEASEVTRAPKDSGTITVDVEPRAVDQNSCLRVEPGEERQLRVRITPSASAYGQAAGTLSIVLVSDANPAQLRASVPWSAQLQNVADTGKKVLIWLALMGVGLALPLLFMWALNTVTATFDPPGALRVARIPVVVSASDQVYRKGQPVGSGVTVAPAEFQPLDDIGRTRRFDVQELAFQSRTPRTPFAVPAGEVVVRSGGVGSLPPPAVGRETTAAPVPFGLAGAAVVLVTDEALDAAPVGLEATIAMALGQDTSEEAPPRSSASDGRRPDVEAELVVFAPADELRRYTAHFDRHRGAVAQIVNALYEIRRKSR